LVRRCKSIDVFEGKLVLVFLGPGHLKETLGYLVRTGE